MIYRERRLAPGAGYKNIASGLFTENTSMGEGRNCICMYFAGRRYFYVLPLMGKLAPTSQLVLGTNSLFKKFNVTFSSLFLYICLYNLSVHVLDLDVMIPFVCYPHTVLAV